MRCGSGMFIPAPESGLYTSQIPGANKHRFLEPYFFPKSFYQALTNTVGDVQYILDPNFSIPDLGEIKHWILSDLDPQH